MLYHLNLKIEAFHKPTETWHVYESKHGLRAVSRKHALDKGLKVATGWPGYTDRVADGNFEVSATAELVEVGQ
jgi:hypothetical protein